MKLVAAALATFVVSSTGLAADAPPGAMACSGCHPNGTGVETTAPRLIGMKAQDISAAMQAFRTGARPATVMDRIAKGFSDAETDAIANWYASPSH